MKYFFRFLSDDDAEDSCSENDDLLSDYHVVDSEKDYSAATETSTGKICNRFIYFCLVFSMGMVISIIC